MRSKYEQQVASSMAAKESVPSLSKKPSKWDQPKGPAPPPINRRDEEEEEAVNRFIHAEIREEELPQSALTKNLLSQFRSIEAGEHEKVTHERKPVRKMTPPRDELEGSIVEYRKMVQEREIVRDPNIIVSGQPADDDNERPPKAFAKSMLTKFKSLELDDAPPPTPERSNQMISRAREGTTTIMSKQTHCRASECSSENKGQISQNEPAKSIHHEEIIEGGVYENEPVQVEGVVRESDAPNEEELPESGFAKSLLSQWRDVEKTTTYIPTEFSVVSPPSSKYGSTTRITHECRMGASSIRSDETDYRDVVRESDQNEEEFLPPAGLSKNITAKFRTLEAENKSESMSSLSSSRKVSHNCIISFKSRTF